MSEIVSWQQLWRSLQETERDEAIDEFFSSLETQDNKQFRRVVGERIAYAYNFRPEFVERMADEKRRKHFKQRVERILEPGLWGIVFYGYFRVRWDSLCNRVHEELGVDIGDEDVLLPSDKQIRTIVADLEEEFSARQLAFYFTFLVLDGEVWAPLKAELSRLRHRADLDGQGDEAAARPLRSAVETRLTDEDKRVYAEFTTLDRVLVDQVISTVSGMEGALTEEELADLIDTVISLNAKRHRSYYHMGFMDALLPDRDVSLTRPEFNDLRKEWYLAGALAGLARQRSAETLIETLKKHESTFQGAARKRGGAGAVMARNLFTLLVDLDRIAEATELLAGQVAYLGVDFALAALDKATGFIRARSPASAMPLLGILQGALPNLDQKSEGYSELSRMVTRRMGQCLQVQGDLEGAQRFFQQLHALGPGSGFQELSGDLGLVQGGYRSLYEVRIPAEPDAQHAMIEGLSRGRELFETDDELDPEVPVNCRYPLAVLLYLQYMNAQDDAARDRLRDPALRHVQDAITAIQASSLASVFEKEGILGQSLFMQAVLQMDRLDPVDARSAVAAWNRITGLAGEFPLSHVKRFLLAAEMVDPTVAGELAQSIWTYRKTDAIDLLLEADVLVHSPSLQKQIGEAALKPALPRSERWRIWSRLVPISTRTGELDLASTGLDQMEELSDSPSEAASFIQFLADSRNCDPVWSEQEACSSRVRVLRLLGRDEECAMELRRLFFMVRDDARGEGQQILDLFRDWRLPETQYRDLSLPATDSVALEAARRWDDRLANGEPVRILFVGGNEIQARYDGQVFAELAEKWPGIALQFAHTGWSPNWGRELDQLVRDANRSDAVVMMRFMRTLLGRRLREELKVPWIPCAVAGKGGVIRSIEHAARVAVEQRAKRGH